MKQYKKTSKRIRHIYNNACMHYTHLMSCTNCTNTTDTDIVHVASARL